MKSVLSLVLTVMLAASPMADAGMAQMAAPEPRGPIGRAVTPEAIRVAMGLESSKAEQTDAHASRAWSKVRQLTPGTEIIVTVRGSSSGRWHAVLSDDVSLTVLNLDHPGLTPDARRELLALASDHPGRFSSERRNVAGRHVRVQPDGVFVANTRIADPEQVVERIAREDIRQIVRPARRRGSKWGAVGGAAAGLLVAVPTAVSLATKQCGGSCRDEEALIWAAVIGFPITGGFLGYRGFARNSTEVIYRSS